MKNLFHNNEKGDFHLFYYIPFLYSQFYESACVYVLYFMYTN